MGRVWNQASAGGKSGGQIHKMGKIFYIMGKSASGKDHIYEALLRNSELGLSPLVLYTTRPIRKNEADGREYHFVNEEKLVQLRLAGRLIEERVYDTISGPWYYFTADEGQIHLDTQDYLGIGTLESYESMRAYFGTEKVRPIYVETGDGIRLHRALRREEKQERPAYAEMCRRFLADCEDFSEEKLHRAGIARRFENNGALEDCLAEIAGYIVEVKNNAVS